MTREELVIACFRGAFRCLEEAVLLGGVKKVGKVDRAKAMFGPTLSVETN